MGAYMGLSMKFGQKMWHLWKTENMKMPGLLLVFLLQKMHFTETWSGHMFLRGKEYLHMHAKNWSYVNVCKNYHLYMDTSVHVGSVSIIACAF